MEMVGVSLSWFWRFLFGVLAFKDNRTARKLGVELIGEVTPTDDQVLMREVGNSIDNIGNFDLSYETLTISDIEVAGGLTEKDVGKVILFK